jgi:tetratricopeptide (TPR) repeat protein
MKTILSTLTLCFALHGTGVQADQSNEEMMQAVTAIQSSWAEVQYHTPGKQNRLDALGELSDTADQLVAQHPQQAEPLIWSAIILATRAGEDGGMGALSLVKRARKQLLAAVDIDETALDGSAHVTLGSLYYQVPRWPIGFGSNKKARQHLERALQINPDGIDANYFYGGYLEKMGDYEAALKAYEKVLHAAARPGREIADTGRREEAKTAINRVQRRHSDALAANSR